MLSIEDLSSLIVVRSAVLGKQLACLIENGDTECNPKHDEILCDLWRLYVIQQTINDPVLLATAEEEDENIYEYWSNIVHSIGGVGNDDYLVANSLFLSYFQYYNNSGSSGSGGGGGDCVCFEPVNGIGRNFTTPTLFNQTHVYNDINELIQAWLFQAQPPSISSITGEFKLNGSSTFVPFATIQKGTIVRDVRVTVSGVKGTNGTNLVETSTTLPSPTPTSPTAQTPASSVTQAYTGEVNNISVTTWAGADQANKSYTGTVKDASGVSTTSSSVTFSYSDLVYYGVAAIPGVNISEAFIKALSTSVLDTDGFINPILFTSGATQHAWFAVPSAYADLIFTDNSVNIAGGFTRVNGNTLLPNGETVLMSGSTVTLTFSNGYSVAYKVYVTDNANIGSKSYKTTAA